MDGTYKIGIRPHNITTYKEGNNSVEINGKVLISELSGSESLIHFTNGKLNWVSLSNGIQSKNIGDFFSTFFSRFFTWIFWYISFRGKSISDIGGPHE